MLKKTVLLASLALLIVLEMAGGINNFQLPKNDYKSLISSFSASLDNSDEDLHYCHRIESVSNDGSLVVLDNNISIIIKWWYRSTPQKWKKGEIVYVAYDLEYKLIKLNKPNSKEIAWGSFDKTTHTYTKIAAFLTDPEDSKTNTILVTTSGNKFKTIWQESFRDFSWDPNDFIIILANSSTEFQVYNVTKNKISSCELFLKSLSPIPSPEKEWFNRNNLLGLEERLNKKVIQQPDAIKVISRAIHIHAAGLKPQKKPVAVFLFLGPTGVGKTELVKCLAAELYHDSSKILRFDMSHFNEPHSTARLIGSPPGYVNHEEGGQLTEPLKNDPLAIVLLDELEKAHPIVRKMFLPVFDEGYICDNKNNIVDCTQTIFIMTSNLCGPEIAQLYRLGYQPDEILPLIEPTLIQILTPELYNRMEPVLFRPIEKESMGRLMDSMLRRFSDYIWAEKQIELIVDDSLKHFLLENGFHPELGARPLNKLIEKRLIAPLAYKMIEDDIQGDVKILMSYDQDADNVEIIIESLYASITDDPDEDNPEKNDIKDNR